MATIGRITSSDETIVLLMMVAPSHKVAALLEMFDVVGGGCDTSGMIGFNASWNDDAFADKCGAGVG